MARTAPVSDWSTDFDVLDPRYVADPFGIWDDLRKTCSIAHTDRRGSTWLPTRYEDVTAIAHDIGHFSSLKVAVIPMGSGEEGAGQLEYGLPRPILRCIPGRAGSCCPGSRINAWRATCR